jgi:uncharacterized peroxidase-related enzyme
MGFKRCGFTLAGTDFGGIMTAKAPLEPRVALLERDQVVAEVADLYDNLLEERGVVPNMFKALANVPPLALGVPAFLKPLMAEGALAGWYKELIATRVALLNHCEYCVSAHRHLAAKRGATFGQIASLEDKTRGDNFEMGPFTEKEKAGFRYASLLHASGHAVNRTAFDALSVYFSPEEIIELTAVAAAFEFFSRFNSSLHIPVTPIPDE